MRMQAVGFIMTFILFIIAASIFPTLDKKGPGGHTFEFIYFFSSFFLDTVRTQFNDPPPCSRSLSRTDSRYRTWCQRSSRQAWSTGRDSVVQLQRQ
jgi:hypothetical protein